MYVEFPKVPFDIGETVMVYRHGRDNEGTEGTVYDGRCQMITEDTYIIQLLIEFRNRERLWVEMHLVEKVIPLDEDE